MRLLRHLLHLLAAVVPAGCSPTPSSTLASEPATATGAPAQATVPAGPSSPEDAWAGLLAAMRAGDEPAMARFATKAGLASLDAGVRDEPRTTAFRRWGEGWSKWAVRWKARTADRANAMLGPEVKEHGLDFARTPGGWKLDRWSPGE